MVEETFEATGEATKPHDEKVPRLSVADVIAALAAQEIETGNPVVDPVDEDVTPEPATAPSLDLDRTSPPQNADTNAVASDSPSPSILSMEEIVPVEEEVVIDLTADSEEEPPEQQQQQQQQVPEPELERPAQMQQKEEESTEQVIAAIAEDLVAAQEREQRLKEEENAPPEAVIAAITEELIAAVEAGGGGAGAVVNPAAMLQGLRAKIPEPLLEQYSEPLDVAPEAATAAVERSELFHKEHARQKKIVRAKPDVKAAKELQSKHPDWPVWTRAHGHPPGVTLGQKFSGRAELWLAAAHQQYFRGIDAAGGAPAYAIVLSGEYEDDDDHGDYLFYTGEGGRAEGGFGQAKDQTFSSPGNAALQKNFEQGVPVRVMRGAKSPDGVISYTYDGLYCVTSAELVPGRSGCLVCKFEMVGIPGHYKATRKVTFLAVRGFKRIQLVREGPPRSRKPGSRKRKKAKYVSSSDEEDDWDDYLITEDEETGVKKARKAGGGAAKTGKGSKKASGKKSSRAHEGAIVRRRQPGPADREELLAKIRERRGLVQEDLTGGAELWPIPVFNETGDGAVLPTDLEYVRESRAFGSTVAAEMATAGVAVMPQQGCWCGVAEQGKFPQIFSKRAYNDDGLLLSTNPFGVWECCGGEACKSGVKCGRNKITSLGMDLLLEVFRTIGRGWGVRCAQDVVPGQVIATYEGELITNAEAESRRGNDAYLFDLDHFILVRSDPSTDSEQIKALPPLPDFVTCHMVSSPTSLEAPDAPHLVVDAQSRGNIGRFFNHSCSPNMVVQPVLTQGCSGLRYRVVFVASEEVPAGVELCYNYGTRYFFRQGDQNLPCACGAHNCTSVFGR